MRLKVEVAYLLALIMSLALVFWQDMGMNRTFELPVDARTKVEPFSDIINGGRSRLTVSPTENGVQLDCSIVSSSTFAFCSMLVFLTGSAIDGVDLSLYDSLDIELDYWSSQRDTLLIYLMNHEVINQVSLDRANMVTLVPENGKALYSVDLRRFHVPSWWVYSRTEAVTSEVDLSNVTKLQISSGDNFRERSLTLNLTKVVLHGKWLSAETLYQGLLIAWLAIAVMHLLVSAVQLNRKHQHSRRQAQEQASLNAFLQTERDKFEQLAKFDPLTGCLNRIGLHEVLESLLVQGRTSNVISALILFDIDHFKRINDQHGHDQGDQVLKNLAELVRQHIRESDSLVRWGGEEFAIVCEHTGVEGALSVAEHLRSLIEQATLYQHSQVTASFGVVALDPKAADTAFAEADNLLYRAKKAGRNQVQPSSAG